MNHAVEPTAGERIHPEGLRGIILLLEEGKTFAGFVDVGGVEAAATEKISHAMLFDVFGDRVPHERNQRLVTKIFARAGAPKFQHLAVEVFDLVQVEFPLRVKADIFFRSRAEQQPIGSHDLSAFTIADDQMIAKRIKVIAIQSALIRSVKTLFHFQIEDLKSQSLPFSNVVFIGRYFYLKVRHRVKKA